MHPASEQIFDSYAEYRAAILEALRLARRTVSIFDSTLAECGLESAAAIAELERLCVETTHAEALRILIKESDHVERNCPRLAAFLNRYAHRASVRRADRDARRQSRVFLIADDMHLVTRPHEELPRGRFNRHDSATTAWFTTQFDTIWSRADGLAIGATLGI